MVHPSGAVRRFCALLAGRLALVVILAVAASLAGAAPSAAEGQVVVRQLDQVIVQGNQRVEPDTIIAYVGATRGQPVTAEQVNDAVRRLYATELFRNVSITPQGDVLLVDVVENPSINRVVFEGNDKVKEEELTAAVESAPRRAFTRAMGQRDVKAIKDLYDSVGRFNATVDLKVEDLPQNRVDVHFVINEGEKTGVGDITFTGNDHFRAGTLREIITTSESGFFSWIWGGDVYDPEKLEYDKELLRRFYLQHGYADVEIVDATAKLSEDKSVYNINFVIKEGPVYKVASVDVTSEFADIPHDRLMEQVTIRPGDIYNAKQVDKTVDNLTFLAGQEGYAFTKVQPRADKHPEDKTLDLTFDLQEGPRVYIERIEIEGNTRTLDRVLRRQFDVAEGDAFNAQKIQQATDRLRALQYFKTVEVTTEQGSAPDRAVIRVKVEEALTGSISFGVGYGTDNGAQGDVSVSERNFLGRGQTISARVAIAGKTQVADFSFREPEFLDRDVSAGFRVFFRQEDTRTGLSYKQTNIGFTPSVRFPMSEDSTLEVSYIAESDEVRDVEPTASEVIKMDEGTQFTSAVKATYVYDRRNDIVSPTNGYLLTASEQLAGLGGDAYYARTVGKGKGWVSFFDDSVVASLEVEGGAIFSLNNDLVITDRFFLGGASLRGFALYGIGPQDKTTGDHVGGNFYAVTRAEVSFPLGLPEQLGMYGGLFADVGTLWGLDQTVYPSVTIDDAPHLRAAIGASLFIDSAFGPLQLSLAYPVVKEDGDDTQYFRFSAGTRF